MAQHGRNDDFDARRTSAASTRRAASQTPRGAREGSPRPVNAQPARHAAPRPAGASARTVNPVRPVQTSAPAAYAGDSDYARNNARYSTKKRKGGPWRVVFVIALVVLVGSLAALGYIGFTYWNGQRAYDDIATENFTPPDDVAGATLADFNVDWDALRAVNPDVVGWVYVAGTSVNYPIVHRDGDDSYYLNHTFGGDTTQQFGAEFGCIMLSGENNADFTDEVNVVYGHNMANGSMFAQFANFTDTGVFNEHRTIYVLTPKGNFRLSTFAVNRIEGTDTTIVVPHQTSSQLAEYVQKRLDDSLVTPDPAPSAASDIGQVFAFSTCDNANDDYRFITFAEVVEYLPAGASASISDATGNGSGTSSTINPNDVSDINSMAEERAS